MSRIGIRLTAIVAAAAILAGCGGAAPKSGGAQSGTSLKKVTIQIDGAAVPYYAPLYVAQQQGFFRAQGLDVSFIYANAADIVKNVAAGNVDFGFPNADAVIAAKANDIPVKVIHTTYQHGIDALMFKNSSGIRSVADLKGKTVAITSYGSPDYIDLQAMLKAAGLQLSDVHIQIVGTGAIVGALEAGKVDAIMFSMLRLYNLKAAGVDVGEILADKYVPSHGNVLVTGDKLLKDDPAEARGFIQALDQGIDWSIKHPADAVKLSVDNYSPSFKGQEKLTTQVLTEVYADYLWQSPQTKEHGLGWGDMSDWQKSIDTLAQYKLIPHGFKAEDLVLEPSSL